MAAYLAHYRSPAAADVRGAGHFEFQSDARAGSKENVHDARLRMLELFGKDAASWIIEDVEKLTTRNTSMDGQMELDFRPPKKKRQRRTKGYW